MIRYSTGGSIIHRTTTPTTRQALVDFITLACHDAGWGTISGTPGSGSDVVLETAAGNQGQKVRFRFLEPASGNCMQITMRHSSGSPTSSIGYCLPGSVLWRVIATNQHFFAFQSGSGTKLTGRAFAAGGSLYVPSFLNLTAGDGTAFYMTNGTSDVDAGPHVSWRNNLRYDTSNTGGLFTGLWVTTMVNMLSWSTNNGAPCIAIWQGGSSSAISGNGYRWEDGTAMAYEGLVSWGTTATGDESRQKGQLYDALVINGMLPGETIFTFDGHDWLAITDVPVAPNAANAQLFVAIS